MHHSPSSLSQACEIAWWYGHVERIRAPEADWYVIEAWVYDGARRLYVAPNGVDTCTPRQRSAALGTAGHAIVEAYYRGQEANWASTPGQIMLPGRAYLPGRDHCKEILVEAWLGEHGHRTNANAPEPGLYLDGHYYTGRIDLRVRLDPSGTEAARLGLSDALRASDGWLTIDHKTTKDFQYAKDWAALDADPQPAIYGIDGLDAVGGTAHPLRWVYNRTSGTPSAKPSDYVLTYTEAKRKLQVLNEHAAYLETKKSINDCVPNTNACGEYGGCPYHASRGGPCTAVPTFRSIGNVMGAFGDRLKAQKEAAAAAGKSAPAAADPAPATASAVEGNGGASEPTSGGGKGGKGGGKGASTSTSNTLIVNMPEKFELTVNFGEDTLEAIAALCGAK